MTNLGYITSCLKNKNKQEIIEIAKKKYFGQINLAVLCDRTLWRCDLLVSQQNEAL
jgi:hypothetical protein